MKSLGWTTITIIAGLPALLGIVVWLTINLSTPDKWCGVQVTDGKIASRPIADCTLIVRDLIHWLGWTVVGALAVVAIAFLTIVARDLRMALEVSGPGDTHIKVGGDPAGDAADKVAGAAVDAAQEVKGEAT